MPRPRAHQGGIKYDMDTVLWHKERHINAVKKYFQGLLSQFFFLCQINLNNLFSSDNLLFWVSND